MKTVGIVGSGIAGLGCAYLLRNDYAVTIFDGNGYAGGHTNTIDVKSASGADVAFDTGFMVFNHQTYPLLTALFAELGVITKKTDMSFSVQDLSSGIQWNGAGLDKIFAQRKNLVNLRFLSMLRELDWFNKNAYSHLAQPDNVGLTVRDYIKKYKLSADFLNLYMVPMGSSVWSTETRAMLDFPAASLIRFFYNHGFLGLDTHYQWYTVDGGARQYVREILSKLGPHGRTCLNEPVLAVSELGSGASITTASGTERFDLVIMAAHADQSLSMVKNPTPQQKRLLSPFKYQDNAITVHKDSSIMPSVRKAWASWNYRTDPSGVATTHYWMNNLQGLKGEEQYFVSLNSAHLIQPELVLRTMSYTHPLFDLATMQAQPELPVLNKEPGNIKFCGSYFAYGFHEDAYRSAHDLCQMLLTGDAMSSERVVTSGVDHV
ncbi:MAG: NAD(P)-binding protein [Candidatus Obscuribacter sp.]|jgi:predicted NAD/FAD-binding protein|nr:NAD(P)-binding protein [Candidatus Obscuribacter sp.]MBK9618451.1 NAD(P)-binding protein [Candidatus Obscuribacter sp.]MBK9772267.1 NAD(P)-binding protein [Candidatus Obscuribacter sp.]MDQ5964528.1 uncharacterized protein [Cyanobacteriota bacterium erpe_2018_sw_39hr_WHONDRS-SW48-000098_B_bin.30]